MDAVHDCADKWAGFLGKGEEMDLKRVRGGGSQPAGLGSGTTGGGKKGVDPEREDETLSGACL